MRRPLGDNIRLEADITDAAGQPFNPTTTKVTVKDSAGTVKVAAANMTNSGTLGSYFYEWQSVIADVAGTYTWFVDAVQGVNTGKQDKRFTLYTV